MKIPAKLVNPFGENIEFDYAKVLEADEQPVDEEAIEKFLKSIEKFYED